MAKKRSKIVNNENEEAENKNISNVEAEEIQNCKELVLISDYTLTLHVGVVSNVPAPFHAEFVKVTNMGGGDIHVKNNDKKLYKNEVVEFDAVPVVYLVSMSRPRVKVEFFKYREVTS